MTDQELAAVKWCAQFWTKIEHWAFAGVIIALAVEFVALKFGEPFKKQLDDAKDLRIEEMRAENLKLQEKLAPRSITPEQQVGLQKELSKLAPRDLDVITCGDSPEIFQFEAMLTAPIKLAGWNVKIFTVVGGGVYSTGVCIESRPGSDSSGADGLLAAIKSQGISANEIKFSNWDKLPCSLAGPIWDQNKIAPIRMWIGAKPQSGLISDSPVFHQ